MLFQVSPQTGNLFGWIIGNKINEWLAMILLVVVNHGGVNRHGFYFIEVADDALIGGFFFQHFRWHAQQLVDIKIPEYFTKAWPLIVDHLPVEATLKDFAGKLFQPVIATEIA